MGNGMQEAFPRKVFPKDFGSRIEEIHSFQITMRDGSTVIVFSTSFEKFLVVVLKMVMRDPSLEDKILSFREVD